MAFVWLLAGFLVGVTFGWIAWFVLGAKIIDRRYSDRVEEVAEQLVVEQARTESLEVELQALRLDSIETTSDAGKARSDLRIARAQLESTERERLELASKVESMRGEVDELERRLREADARNAELAGLLEAQHRIAAELDTGVTSVIDPPDLSLSEPEEPHDRREPETGDRAEAWAGVGAVAEAPDGSANADTSAEDVVPEATPTSGAVVAPEPDGAGDLDSSFFDDREAQELVQGERVLPSWERPADAVEAFAETAEGIDEEGSEHPTSDDGSSEVTEPGEPSDREPGPGAAAEEQSPRESAIEKVADIARRTMGEDELPEDDLKEIRGIGPKTESMLKRMGITTFVQIAHLTPEDLETITAALDAFPGRAQRDGWVVSARELLAQRSDTVV